MANRPFDQRIINLLERPTSSDLNIAFSQLNAATGVLLTALTQAGRYAGTGSAQTGCVGSSFLLFPAIPSDMTILMSPGLGRVQDGSTQLNIDSILGLNNLLQNTVYSGVRTDSSERFTVPAGPGAGFFRRDVIAIRRPVSTEGLDDYTETDIYDSGIEAFDSVLKPKTYTADSSQLPISVINYNETPTDPVVYIKGEVQAYSTPDDILSATPPYATGFSYLNIGVINVVESPTSIGYGQLIDARRVLAPNNTLTLTGRASIGASAGNPGAALANVSISTPAGIRASIYKAGADSATPTNTYILAVFGPRAINRATINIAAAIPGSEDPGSIIWNIRPFAVLTGPQALNQQVNDAAKTLYANGTKVNPTQVLAIGQPVHYFQFTLGTVENQLTSQTFPITLTPGSITIPPPPDYPAMYPAGLYSISGNTDVRSYYLNYGDSAASPTTGLQTPTYLLGTTSTATVSDVTASITTSWSRLMGFVTSPTGASLSIPQGVWRLSFRAGSNGTPVKLRAKAYLYNGLTDPETGTLLAQSDNIILPAVTASQETQYIDVYMRFASTTSVGSNRIYVVFEAYSDSASAAVFRFGNDNPGILETNIATTAPTVTIPNSTTDYPADTYTVTGASASSITVSLPSSLLKFNPKALFFKDTFGSEYQTVPITFTVTLDTSSSETIG